MITLAAGVIVGIGLQLGVPPDSAADVCAPVVDQALRQYGLSLEVMQDVSWDIDRWNDTDTLPRELQPISGYRFYGRPQQCSEGRLTIALTAQCGITDIRSRSGCRIPGMRYGWF